MIIMSEKSFRANAGNLALSVPQEIKDRKENLVLMENMEDQDLGFS